MNTSSEAFLLFVIGLLFGGLVGYVVCRSNMKDEAIANGAARWEHITYIDSYGHQAQMTDFAWNNKK